MLNITKKLTTKNCYVGKNKPKYIVVHETDNTSKGAGAERHAIAMYNGNLSGTVHYYVDDKAIYQTLEHKHGAYAVGDNGNKISASKYGIHNQNSINIEICVNPDSNYDKAVSNTIDLVKHIMKDENISINNVVRHYDATRKNCPRKIIANGAWDDFKKRVQNNTISTNVPKTLKNGDYSGRKAKVTASVLNVRYDRGTQYNVIGKLNKGDTVKLNYCLNGWVSIEGYKGNKGLGYVSTDYLELI